MEYRNLGPSGLKVSALSIGTWVTFGDQIDEHAGAACLKAAYDAGVNFFDTAEVYAGGKAEIMMGAILRNFGWKRSDLVSRANTSSKARTPRSAACRWIMSICSIAIAPIRTRPSKKPSGP
jgi:aryl-alcohol dehydrogenase-like predicted oxidoreductase